MVRPAVVMLVGMLLGGCTAQVADRGASERDAVTADGGIDAAEMPCPVGEHACPFGPQGWACIDGNYYCALDTVACQPPATSCVPWNGQHGDASNLPD